MRPAREHRSARGSRRSVVARAAAGLAVGAVVSVGIALLLGVDLQRVLRGAQTRLRGTDAPVDASQDELKRFVSAVVADTERTWGELFARAGTAYPKPWIVMFNGRIEPACGYPSFASGSFYCPADGKMYLDLSFLGELRSRFRKTGDLAATYVVAHEVGHHVQHAMRSDPVLAGAHGGGGEAARRVELQADFLAGVWAHHARTSLDAIDPRRLDQALGAAAEVGGERLRDRPPGHAVPDSFTHDTAAERAAWFRRGFESGDPFHADASGADPVDP